MDEYVANDPSGSDPSNIHSDGASNVSNGMLEAEFVVRTLEKLDSDLAYASEKLRNLELYATKLSVQSDLRSLTLQDIILTEDYEKALMFDLSSVYLDFEVRELVCFLDVLQAEVVGVSQKISSCQHVNELISVLQKKLYTSEMSLECLSDQVSHIKKQLVKLQKTPSHNEQQDSHLSPSEDETCDGLKLKMYTPEQQRLVLRMLDKSLAVELDCEKRLIESQENEEKLKTKLCLADHIVLNLKSETESALERLLEAEYSAGIFKGIAKEMMGHLQIVQFKLKFSIRREDELKSKLQICLDQLEAKEAVYQKLEHSQLLNESKALEHKTAVDHTETNAWMEKVKVLEEKVNESESSLKQANASNEVCQLQLAEMGNINDSLRVSLCMAERRAEEAEAKLATATETNHELTEELGFLKGGDSSVEKISLLEKQVRELEKHLQHAKASSEASQEQQNMLYAAIWDMETLIEDLKSKVSKAETRTENAEEQCLLLAEANMELHKEISYLKTRSESLEASLKEAHRTKKARVKDISSRANLITEMVMQLAIERERIQKQLYSLARENQILMEEFRKNKRSGFLTSRSENSMQVEKELSPRDDSSTSRGVAGSNEKITVPPLTSDKVDSEPSNEAFSSEAEEVSSSPDNVTPGVTLEHETRCHETVGNLNIKYIFLAILVLVVSVLAMSLCKPDIFLAIRHHVGLR